MYNLKEGQIEKLSYWTLNVKGKPSFTTTELLKILCSDEAKQFRYGQWFDNSRYLHDIAEQILHMLVLQGKLKVKYQSEQRLSGGVTICVYYM